MVFTKFSSGGSGISFSILAIKKAMAMYTRTLIQSTPSFLRLDGISPPLRVPTSTNLTFPSHLKIGLYIWTDPIALLGCNRANHLLHGWRSIHGTALTHQILRYFFNMDDEYTSSLEATSLPRKVRKGVKRTPPKIRRPIKVPKRWKRKPKKSLWERLFEG